MSNTQCCQITTARLFARQDGVASRSQLLAAGVTPRMIQWRVGQGLWVAVHPGVYRMVAVPVTWNQRVRAACLAARGVASHRAAGALWGLDGMSGGTVDVMVAGTNRRRLQGVTVHHTRTLAPGDTTQVDGIPCTSAARTLIDLAAVLDGEALEQALDSALREGKTSVAYLVRRLAATGSSGRKGADVLRNLLADRIDHRPSESRREAQVARLLVEAGLPPPTRQHELRHGGRVVARFDLAYPEARIGVEFQSYRHHFGRQAWRRDTACVNRAAAHDWLLFNVTEDDIRDGCRSVANSIRRALPARMTPKLPVA